MCKDCGCSAARNSQVRFYVHGYDGGNAGEIERSLLGLPGVYHVHIHVHDGQTTIAYDPDVTPLATIAGALTNRGLRVVL